MQTKWNSYHLKVWGRALMQWQNTRFVCRKFQVASLAKCSQEDVGKYRSLLMKLWKVTSHQSTQH